MDCIVPVFHRWQAAFDLEMRGGKAVLADAVFKKPSGKEMFLRHLVAEEEELEAGAHEGKRCCCCAFGSVLGSDFFFLVARVRLILLLVVATLVVFSFF